MSISFFIRTIYLLLGLFFLDNAFASINFTDQEKNYLQEKKQITMCIDPDWMPLEKIDQGKHIGMTADYIAIFQEKIGIPVVLVNTSSWSQSMEFARNL